MAEIFVFGSNLAGRHGKGAALYARTNYGAKYGVGEGISGYSYAIPTKDDNLNTLPLDRITESITRFADFARAHQSDTFLLTPIGCGLAGYKISQIKPIFDSVNLPSNVIFLPTWFS